MTDYKKLQLEFAEALCGTKGRIGVLCEDLATGTRAVCVSEDGKLTDGADDVFESASVIKLWIMSAAFARFQEGTLAREQEVTLQESDQVPPGGLLDYRADQLTGCLTTDMFPESGILNYLTPGLKLTVSDLVRMMIILSDNTATNMMIDLLGLEAINAHIQSLGAKKTLLARRLFDRDPLGLHRENLISLRETADWFRRLYEGKLVSAEASREMNAILQNQQTTYKIPFYIQDLPIAHKTGEDLGIANDCGIVYSEAPYIFCFASNRAEVPQAVRICQELAARPAGRG